MIANYISLEMIRRTHSRKGICDHIIRIENNLSKPIDA